MILKGWKIRGLEDRRVEILAPSHPHTLISSSSSISRIKHVASFEELLATPWAAGVNALCWTRTLSGDFAEIVRALGRGEGVVKLDERRLLRLNLSPAGQAARDILLADQRRLRDHGLQPELNCIHGYPRDEDAVPTHVFSYHADSAPVEADTYLCTYHGSPSEGLPNEQAIRRTDDPVARAALRQQFGDGDEAGFDEWLHENCHDLHYAPLPGAQPYSFGLGHLWRIALERPDCPVPPCIHRAPATIAGQPRLLLIS